MLGLGEPNVISQPPIGDRWGQAWEEWLERNFLASTGEPGMGLPQVYTQWDGLDWANIFSSADSTLGQALRVRSQDDVYGMDVENAGMTIFGAPTMDAFTQGSVLFVGTSKVLSEDDFFWDAANNRLGVATRSPAQNLHVVGNGQVSTFFGAGGAPDTTYVGKFTGASSIWATGKIQSDGDLTVGATKLVVTASDGSLNIGPNKFTVAGGSGNTLIAGTADVTGDLKVNTDKLVVTASTGATAQAGSQTFVGTGLRILADFSNATTANRLIFQSSTANGVTGVVAIPNGSGTSSGWLAYGASSTTASALIAMQALAAETRIVSTNVGATTLPLKLVIDTTTRIEMNTTGIGFFAATPVAKQTVDAAVSGTADGTYSGTEQNMLNDLKSAVNSIRTALINYGLAS